MYIESSVYPSGEIQIEVSPQVRGGLDCLFRSKVFSNNAKIKILEGIQFWEIGAEW